MITDAPGEAALTIRRIHALRAAADREISRLEPEKFNSTLHTECANCWCRSAAGDAILRTKIVIDENFRTTETLSIVATSRYLLELHIWLKLFRKDRLFGLLYYGQLIESQARYYESSINQFKREARFLDALEAQERSKQDEISKSAKDETDFVKQLNAAGEQIDEAAARHFSIYSSAARTNGYGFQAHLIRKKAIPAAEAALQDVKFEAELFDSNIAPKINSISCDRNGKLKRWNWSESARNAGLSDEYEYIYSFSSKLLHATPSSISTDSKSLTPEEVNLFLKYIEVKIRDIIEEVASYPTKNSPCTH